MKTIGKTISIAAAALLVAASSSQEPPVRPVVPKETPKDVLELIAAKPELSLFAEAVKAAGLEGTLRGRGPWTLFAPTNEAFRALPEGTMTEWSKPENRAVFSEVISYHAVRGFIPADEVPTAELTTLQGSRLVLKNADGMLWVGRAEVLQRGIEGTNGVVHVINMVMEPDAQ
jgi:uncharacterized surface protein with fasciclin (FAS1) repeats